MRDTRRNYYQRGQLKNLSETAKYPWQVVLDIPPKTGDIYPPQYFPLKFHYKKDAEILNAEIWEAGGMSHIERTNKIQEV